MAQDIAALIRQPGYITVGSSTTPSTTTNLMTFKDDIVVDFVKETDPLEISIIGTADETIRNRFVRISGNPIVYPVASGNSTLFGWLWPWSGSPPPVPGTSLFASSQPIYILSTNGDGLVVYNCAVVKPPDLVLAVDKSIVGPFEAIGLIRNTYDPETASSFFLSKGVLGGGSAISYSSPVLLQTGDLIGRQRYYLTWTAGNTTTGNSTFTAFEAEKGISISHEALGDFIAPQGQQADWALRSYRAMARLIPIGPTGTDIEKCLGFQGIAAAKQGSRLSAATVGDLVITGQFGLTATIKNAVLKTAGFRFGSVTLRYGEIGFVGTFNLTSAGAHTGGLTLA